MNWNEKTVLVTGGHGFLGSYVIKELERRNVKKINVPTSTELDLRNLENCKKAVQNIDIVIHLAGAGGGIGVMREKPGEIFFNNIMMGTQLMHQAKEANVEKFIGLGTICSYPKMSPIPFREESLWDGYPEETNAAYGLSKKMMLVQSEAYRQQYDFKSIVLFPTNLYGPADDFNPSTSHVIPGIILKVYNAKKNNSDSITLWGDGSPSRDFLYVEDAARASVAILDSDFINQSIVLTGQEPMRVYDLLKTLGEILGIQGGVEFLDSGYLGHYVRTPYAYLPKLGRKYSASLHIDLGQGLLQLIEEIKHRKSD